MVKFHIAPGCTVQIEDTHYFGDDRLRYAIHLLGNAMQLVDDSGRQIGIFADLGTLLAHPESVIGRCGAEVSFAA